MKVTNTSDSTAYFPGDGVTHELKAGATVDVRLGVADYAVRNIPGVRFASDDEGLVNGVSEASVEAAVAPIAEHVTDDPTDVRYAVVGDVPGSDSVEVVPGSPADHVEPGVSAESAVLAEAEKAETEKPASRKR